MIASDPTPDSLDPFSGSKCYLGTTGSMSR